MLRHPGFLSRAAPRAHDPAAKKYGTASSKAEGGGI
jgi:hypothetical protein